MLWEFKDKETYSQLKAIAPRNTSELGKLCKIRVLGTIISRCVEKSDIVV